MEPSHPAPEAQQSPAAAAAASSPVFAALPPPERARWRPRWRRGSSPPGSRW